MPDAEFDAMVASELEAAKDGQQIAQVRRNMSDGANPAQMSRLFTACDAKVDQIRKAAADAVKADNGAAGGDKIPSGSLV